MAELLQLYNEQGKEIEKTALPREEVFEKGILHGAVHVWIWRQAEKGIEVGIQKRSRNMRSWPGRFDISAAGHITHGANEIETAIREVNEELGLTVEEDELSFLFTYRTTITVASYPEWTENEIQWVYLLELPRNADIHFKDHEVEAFEWKTIDAFEKEVLSPGYKDKWVPHDLEYFEHIVHALKNLS